MFDAVWLLLLTPLGGSLIIGTLGHRLGRRGIALLACGVVGLAFTLAAAGTLELLGRPAEERAMESTLYSWIALGDFRVSASLLWDPLSSTMSLVVTGVGFLIHLYSVGYMAEDPGFRRYFAYLNLFIFSMLLLVLADNFLLLYVGWELVGLCSYLLIGFWYERREAALAGMKAFVVNRIGDFGFALGVLTIFLTFGTLRYAEVFAAAPQLLAVGSATATAIALLLFVGAIGKSAQLPLYVWLPDAMEGPTPVSALIHAATMVTAGVYLVARTHVLFELAPLAAATVALIGVLTALYAASIATVQDDIKRVLAYSTISQLGYMFLAMGIGAYAAGLFHLVTHAFFKALMFLGAGSVMHALANELNIQRMGGLARRLPITSLTFAAGWLSIAGLPPFSGFFSKDEILAAAFSSGHMLLWAMGMATAALTAFYMSRHFFLVFLARPRTDRDARRVEHAHESPALMTGPLIALAVLATLGGSLGSSLESYLEPVFEVAERTSSTTVTSGPSELALIAWPLAAAVAGIGLAWLAYLRGAIDPVRWARRLGPIYGLLKNKYYVDELYDALLVRPVVGLAELLAGVLDQGIIDGAVNGIGLVLQRGGAALRQVQSGYVRLYAFTFFLGVVGILVYLIAR